MTISVAPVSNASDLRTASDLLCRFFLEEGFATAAATIVGNARRMAELGELCLMLVARVDGVPSGVATASLDFGIEFGWQAEIGDLYVVPEARQKGVARSLFDACATWARSRGAGSLAVTVTMHGAGRDLDGFYRRLGFSDDGRRILTRGL